MGLSNEERIVYLERDFLYLMDHFDKLKQGISVDFPTETFKILRQRLIHSYYASNREAGAWVFGISDNFNSRPVAGPTVLSVSVLRGFEESSKTEDTEKPTSSSFAAFWEAHGSSMEKHFNDKGGAWAFTTVQIVESLFYPLRRYDDNFMATFKEFDNVLTEVLFEAKRIINDTDIMQAYCQHALYDLILDGGYLKDEHPVARWFMNHCLHHGFGSYRRYNRDTKEIAKVFKEVQKKYILPNPRKQLPVEDMIRLILLMQGGHYSYDHQFKDLEEICNKNNIPTKAIKAQFETCKKLKAEKDASNTKVYSNHAHCFATGQYWYSDMEKDSEPLQPKLKK